MKLLTKEIKDRMPKLYETDGVPLSDKKIVAKFFNPCGAGTWLVVEGQNEGNPDDEDYLFFGWAEIHPGGGEWGYFQQSELEGLELPFGLGIERDLDYGPKTFGETEYDVMR